MTEVRARIAEALREHRETWDLFTQRYVCTCDRWNDDEPTRFWEHLTSVLLALDGIAVVALPEPDPEGRDWMVGKSSCVWVGRNGKVRLGINAHRPSDARELAAALLAAADAAEQAGK